MQTFEDETFQQSLFIGKRDMLARAEEARRNSQHTRGVALAIMRSSKSDPFAFDRTMSHLQSGVSGRHNYSVREVIEDSVTAGGEHFKMHRINQTARP